MMVYRFASRTFAFCAAVLLCASGAEAITFTWDGEGGDNQWHNFDNWSPNGIPSGVDDVVIGPQFSVRHLAATGNTSINSLDSQGHLIIEGGILSVATASQVDDLLLSGGTLAGNGTWTVGSALLWRAGNISGLAIVPVGAVLIVSDVESKNLSGRLTLDGLGYYVARPAT